jgi:histidinol-phosphate/aromatic aminotransferase/cobyric acid decarboxylase-like protein/choline kinase
MQAMILAAGMGKRLGKYTREHTKCMVEVNGETLLNHSLKCFDGLKEDGINLSRIVMVIGYQGDKIRDYLGAEYKGIPVEYVDNEDYAKTNNIYSLWMARDYLVMDDTILLESDLIFKKELLRQLVESDHENMAVVSPFAPYMDGTVTLLDDEDSIISLISRDRFRWKDTDLYYKTVNIYKFSQSFSEKSYIPFLNAYIDAFGNNEYYEQVLKVLVYTSGIDLKALNVPANYWYEIDDVQDLKIAEVFFSSGKEKLKKIQDSYGGYWRYENLLDFCYLVNPYFPTKNLKKEIISSFDKLISHYPSGQNVQNLLASKMFGVDEECILLGNGAAELIKGLGAVIGGRIGVIAPTFNEYPQRLGEERVEYFIPANPDFSYTVEDIIAFTGELRGLILINPDNPSGHYLTEEDLLRLADHFEKAGKWLVVDESFVDFAEPRDYVTLLDQSYMEKYPHLVVVKSISKSYGVPGIRLGVLAAGDKGLIRKIRSELSIWNINSFGEYFMQIIGKHKKEYQHAALQIQLDRDKFKKDLDKFDWLRVIPSQANYFLCELTGRYKASELTEMLIDRDIYIKDCTGKRGFENKEYIRLAVRDKNDNKKLIKALKKLS